MYNNSLINIKTDFILSDEACYFSARVLPTGFRPSVRMCFFQFFLQSPAVQFSVLSTFQPALSSDCRFFLTAFRSVRLPSSLRFLILRLNFAFAALLSLRCRPSLLLSFSLEQAAVIASFLPLSQELALRFRSTPALSYFQHFCLPSFRAFLPFALSLQAPSLVSLLPALRASRPTPSFLIARSFFQIRFLSFPVLLCTFLPSLTASPLSLSGF